MTSFERVRDIIKKFYADQDKLFSEYQKSKKAAREKYSSEGYKTEFLISVYPRYAGTARSNADIAVHEIESVYEELKADFFSWIMKPLQPEILQTLNLINDYGLKPSLSELRVIEKNISGNYWGVRIFSGLTKKAGYNITVPNMETYLKELESVRNNSVFAVRAYAGPSKNNFPGRDLIDTWKHNGIDYGEYHPQHMVMAEQFLKTGGQLDRVETLWIQSNSPVKYTLSSDEAEKIRNKIDEIIDPYGGAVDKEKADKLIEEIPDVLSRLESISGDFPNKKTAVQYFSLSGAEVEQKEKEEILKNKSRIDPAGQQAAEYKASRHEKISPESLKNFE